MLWALHTTRETASCAGLPTCHMLVAAAWGQWPAPGEANGELGRVQVTGAPLHAVDLDLNDASLRRFDARWERCLCPHRVRAVREVQRARAVRIHQCLRFLFHRRLRHNSRPQVNRRGQLARVF